jgi:Protein of unknown function (DUF2738)
MKHIIYDEIDVKRIKFVIEDTANYNSMRIKLRYLLEEEGGKEVDLIIAPKTEFYSFGVQRNRVPLKQKDNAPSGPPTGPMTGTYSMCLCVSIDTQEKDPKAKVFCLNMQSIYKRCKEYLKEYSLEHPNQKIDIDQFKCPLRPTPSDLNKKEFKLYAKLITTKHLDVDKVVNRTLFMDSVKKEKKYLFKDLVEREETQEEKKVTKRIHCYVYPAILVESLFIQGNNASLQCKLSEAGIRMVTKDDDKLSLNLDFLELAQRKPTINEDETDRESNDGSEEILSI